MLRRLMIVVAAAAVSALVLEPALAAPPDSRSAAKTAKSKRPSVVVRRTRGYGFLPGYEPPDRPNMVRDYYDGGFDGTGRRYINWYGQLVYGWGGPGYYRGRWNGGGFGPCWTQTPIGPIWNCGK